MQLSGPLQKGWFRTCILTRSQVIHVHTIKVWEALLWGRRVQLYPGLDSHAPSHLHMAAILHACHPSRLPCPLCARSWVGAQESLKEREQPLPLGSQHPGETLPVNGPRAMEKGPETEMCMEGSWGNQERHLVLKAGLGRSKEGKERQTF